MTRGGAAAAALLLVASAAHAGRPLSVEDASVVEDHACQIEAWVDRSRDVTTGWAVPSCNFFWDTEWQAGFARSHEERTRFTDAYLQAKTLFREATPENRWGFATVLGVIRRPTNERFTGYDNPFVLAVLTVVATDAPLLVHANVGWSRDREASREATLWGLAAESPVAGSSVSLLGEVFGDTARQKFWRIGTRWAAIPNRLEFDLSYLARLNGTPAERFISIGVTWQTGRLGP